MLKKIYKIYKILLIYTIYMTAMQVHIYIKTGPKYKIV